MNEEIYCPNCKQKVVPVKKIVQNGLGAIVAIILSIVFLGIGGLLLFPIFVGVAYLFASKQCPKCGHKFK